MKIYLTGFKYFPYKTGKTGICYTAKYFNNVFLIKMQQELDGPGSVCIT